MSLQIKPEIKQYINPLVANGHSHPYHLDESIFIFRDIGSNFFFVFHFSFGENRIVPAGMPRFAVSHLGLFCLTMSHKKDVRLIWIKYTVRETDFSLAKEVFY